MSEVDPSEHKLAMRLADVLANGMAGSRQWGELTWRPVGNGDGFKIRYGSGGLRIIYPDAPALTEGKGSNE